jgi:TPR repeat protein
MDQSKHAERLQLGVNAFMGNRYPEAFEILLPLAEAGEVEAQKLVARLYFSGNGVERDRQRYIYWLEQAAALGDRQSKAKLKRFKDRKW